MRIPASRQRQRYSDGIADGSPGRRLQTRLAIHGQTDTEGERLRRPPDANPGPRHPPCAGRHR
ncbi:hypothetical protein chiPu_0027367, partial [Chiloscyllium punctatum]|nr:hypothetical protein [Chiloscyllium punctatum]